MALDKRFPIGGWASITPIRPSNPGQIKDWALIGGKAYFIVDLNEETSMVLLRTYLDVEINYWFFSEWLIPAVEPVNSYRNRMLEEYNKATDFQKKLGDQLMRKVFK